MLHVAPEPALEKLFRQYIGAGYLTADLFNPDVMIIMDITDIQYADNSFDVIICNHVLEHVMADHQAMSEIFRVLKPGGWAILQVPVDRNRETTFENPSITSPRDRERLFGKDDHVRVYGLDYKDRLEKAGFQVKLEKYINELDADTIEQHCLRDVEDIYFCRKLQS